MRTILKMHRQLSGELPSAPAEIGFDIRTFNLDADKNAWLELNNEIFKNHPDQGNWAMADLENRMKEPWFDPTGFFLAMDNQRIIGFCWTKFHQDLVNQEPVGEIYVIGVDRTAVQRGVGQALAVRALEFMKSKGLSTAMLYVDADNQAGLALYKKLGFN
jgi:mycothiol synthase